MVFGKFWSSWGLVGAPPILPVFEGLCNHVLFTPHTTKLPATVTLLGSVFAKNIATYLVAE